MRVLVLLGVVALLGCGRAALTESSDGGTGGGDFGGGAGGGNFGGGAGGGGASTCAGLMVEACRARPDCAADFCFICSCTPRYEGCRGVNELPHACPDVECLQPECCDSQGDCTAPAMCAVPGTPPGCGGACNPLPGGCLSDSDCIAFPTVSICEPIACSCYAQRECVPGCGPSSPCEQGTTCNATTGRCQVQSCVTSSDCPGPFTCSAGACLRKPCVVDSQCGDGFCVLLQCYEGLGVCRFPMP